MLSTGSAEVPAGRTPGVAGEVWFKAVLLEPQANQNLVSQPPGSTVPATFASTLLRIVTVLPVEGVGATHATVKVVLATGLETWYMPPPESVTLPIARPSMFNEPAWAGLNGLVYGIVLGVPGTGGEPSFV